jgi:hypothetical protein
VPLPAGSTETATETDETSYMEIKYSGMPPGTALAHECIAGCDSASPTKVGIATAGGDAYLILQLPTDFSAGDKFTIVV